MHRLFLINRQSKHVAQRGSQLERSFEKSNITAPIIDVGDFSVLPQIVKEARDNKTSHVFIESGDGTVHGVMSAFLKAQHEFSSFPNFTLISGGMTNQIAKNIGISKHISKRLERVLAGHGRSLPMPLLEIKTGDDKINHGFLLSTGVVPHATQHYETQMRKGTMGANISVFLTIMRTLLLKGEARDKIFKPHKITLEIEQTAPEGKNSSGEHLTLNEDHLLTLTTTLPTIMMGLNPFWGRGNAPLKATYLPADMRRLIWHIFNIWLGRYSKTLTRDGAQSFTAHRLSFTYDRSVVIDGEPLTCPDGFMQVTPTMPVNFIS